MGVKAVNLIPLDQSPRCLIKEGLKVISPAYTHMKTHTAVLSKLSAHMTWFTRQETHCNAGTWTRYVCQNMFRCFNPVGGSGASEGCEFKPRHRHTDTVGPQVPNQLI